MNIFVRMFDDRIEIESPGPFLPLVSPNNIYEVHHRRNFFLMDAMFYMDFVKCENEGAKRIRDAMRAMSLPAPEFSQKEIGHAVVRVTLRNNITHREQWVDKDVSDIVGQLVAQSLSEDERRIIARMAENGKVDITEAQKLTGKGWGASKKMLEGLCTKKITERVSRFTRDPKAHYRLKQSPQP
jgi:ATP-dependent DNA helicase RecG